MSNHLHFDEAKVRAAIEKIAKQRAGQADDATFNGCYTRLALEIMPTFQIGLTREVNRGASGADLCKAITALMTNFALSWAMSVTSNQREDTNALTIAINYLLADFASVLEFAITNRNAPESESGISLAEIKPEQSGRA